MYFSLDIHVEKAVRHRKLTYHGVWGWGLSVDNSLFIYIGLFCIYIGLSSCIFL